MRARTSKPWLLSDPDATDRFAWFVEPEPMSGCHLWSGPTDRHGYGKLHLKPTHDASRRKIFKAHRAAWIITNGDIPPGMSVLHTCDNPTCVNVDHLRLGTHAENVLDMARKGRGTKSKRGMPYGVHPYGARFAAGVSVLNQSIHVGVFDTIEEAADAAMRRKLELLSEVA